MVVLIIICTLSISINILQYSKISNYNKQEKFYTKMFQNDFNELITSFNLYNGSGALSNESAIKNSASIVANLGSIRSLTSYGQSKSMSEMLLYLSEYFVLNSNEVINKDINEIKPQLQSISKTLNDEEKIKNLNIILWKRVSKEK
jgi:hypothetical protein